MYLLFAFTEDDHWAPGIGDPTVVGWVTVAAYFIAAFLSWRAMRAASELTGVSRGPVRFWAILTAVLVFLGFNKQLDLQTWFTLFFKHLALEEGWYEIRRKFQAAFIAGVAIAGSLSLVGMRMLAGSANRSIRTALTGSVFLGCFILIRASSFHHVDQMLGMDLGGLKVNWILELGSIAVIGYAAQIALTWPHRAPSERALRPGPGISPNFIWVTAGDRLKDSTSPLDKSSR
jgi:hypothetical protein